MPRKKIEIDIKRAEELANLGLNFAQIADGLGISVDTLERRRKDSAVLRCAVQKGQSCAVAHVAGKLMEAIDNGDVKAMIFFLKTRAGWNEKTSIEVTHPDSEDEKLTRRNILRQIPTIDLMEIIMKTSKAPELERLRDMYKALFKDVPYSDEEKRSIGLA